MMRVEAPRQFLPNVRSSGLAFRLELAPSKKSLTMENVFAPQAQQLQTAISPERSIAAEVCRA